MSVMTVTGPVEVETLGITTIHEHMIVDGSANYKPPDDPELRKMAESPLRMDTIGWARKVGWGHLDNCYRLDVDEAIEEINHFKSAGGQTVVDQTPAGTSRDPKALRKIAEATGLNIIMGGGYYEEVQHPEYIKERTVDDIANEIIREINVGVDGTEIRMGIIGEVGTGNPVTSDEEKVLRASAKAQASTGTPLSIHHNIWGRHGPKVLSIAKEEGADLNHTLISHVDLDARCDLSYYEAIASTGAYLGFDTFGQTDAYQYKNIQRPGRVYPTDYERAENVAKAVEAGYLKHIVLAMDLAVKTQIKRYGGFGYDHLLDCVVPMFHAVGLTTEQIDVMLVDNPARLLDRPI